MLRFYRLVAVAVLTAVAGAAQAQAAADARGFLWEARKGDARIHLLGTIHVGRAEAALPSMECARRYADAEVVALEADVFDAEKVGAVVQRLAVYPPGEPGLDSRLPESLRKRVDALLPRYGLNAGQVARMKPWMLGNTLTILEAAHNGYNPAFATEAVLYAYAKRCGKPVVEIEGVERQLKIFDSASDELQIRILEQTVAAIESGAAVKEMQRIVAAWEAGDTEAAERLLAEMRSSQGAAERFVVEKLLEGRHPQMVETAERYAASGKLHLFAVGSLHYFGPNGLLALLRARGYTITQVK